jgi:hypothetical protein
MHSRSGGRIVRDSTRTDRNATMRLPRQPVNPTGVGPDDIFAPATHSVPLFSPAGLRTNHAVRALKGEAAVNDMKRNRFIRFVDGGDAIVLSEDGAVLRDALFC